MIPKHHSANFQTLARAFDERRVCLMECNDAKTNEPVYAICMVNVDGDRNYEMIPVAQLIEGNPYEQLTPPSMEE